MLNKSKALTTVPHIKHCHKNFISFWNKNPMPYDDWCHLSHFSWKELGRHVSNPWITTWGPNWIFKTEIFGNLFCEVMTFQTKVSHGEREKYTTQVRIHSKLEIGIKPESNSTNRHPKIGDSNKPKSPNSTNPNKSNTHEWTHTFTSAKPRRDGSTINWIQFPGQFIQPVNGMNGVWRLSPETSSHWCVQIGQYK